MQYFTPGLGPEILNVGNHLKPIQFYMLSTFCVTKCQPFGCVLALLLLLAVYGSGLGPDGPDEPEEP